MRKLLVWLVASVSVIAFGACGGGGSSSGGSTNDFCNALKGYTTLFNSNDGNEATPQQFLAALSDLSGKAPSEIKSDMAAITAAVTAEQSLASVASSDPSQADALESQFSSQADALEKSSANVEKFAKDKCGIDLSSSNSSKFDSVASSLPTN